MKQINYTCQISRWQIANEDNIKSVSSQEIPVVVAVSDTGSEL